MFEIARVGAHNPCRLRVYTSEEAMRQDEERPLGLAPQTVSGLVLEVVLEAEWALNPTVFTTIHPNDLFALTSVPTTVWFEFRETSPESEESR